MNIRIVCVGKVKEKFYRDALSEYVKRLGAYARVEISEVSDEKTPEGCSETVKQQILDKEGERILKKIRDGEHCVALAIAGREYDSPEFADHIKLLMNTGKSTIVFVIGGSLGLSDAVMRRADETLSFSRFTFPHQLMRVILAEQIYRGFRILNGEPYHK